MFEIVFVQPPLSRWDRYGALSSGGSSLPPFGLAWLAAVARREGAKTAIIDAEAEGLGIDAVADRLMGLRPASVGFTATTISVGRAAAVGRRLRELGYGGTLVIGGAHVTACPVETLKKYPVFDLAVIGEGEATLKELLDLLPARRDDPALRSVAGLALHDEEVGVHLTKPRQFLSSAELAQLPIPALDLLPPLHEAYQPSALRTNRLPASSLVTTRGCGGRCTFCDNSVFGRRIRAFPAGYVLEMVNVLTRDYGIRELSIYDDNFIVNRKRLAEFCDSLRTGGTDLSWSCNARVDVITPELVDMVRSSGCWQISLGIESGVQEILDRECKGITLEQVERAVTLLSRGGIRTKGFFMVGHPGETLQTAEQTVRFALELPLDDFQMSFLTPFPGTCLHSGISRWGELDEDWESMNMWTPVFVPHGMTREQLMRIQKTAMQRFYFRPRIVLRYLKKLVRNPAAAGALFRGALALLKGVLTRF